MMMFIMAEYKHFYAKGHIIIVVGAVVTAETIELGDTQRLFISAMEINANIISVITKTLALVAFWGFRLALH
jgi:hypothetical protein